MLAVFGAKRLTWVLVLVVGAVLAGSAPGVAATETFEAVDGAPDGGSAASYEGRLIDLSDSWQGAGACLVAPEQFAVAQCFDTESELEAFVTGLGDVEFVASGPVLAAAGPPVSTASSSCSSYLKLYDGTSYTGSSLWLSTRWSWINLSLYGFDQRTSSFKIGACSAYFADLAGGGGAWYPTSGTQAYDVASTMASGWNNDVSSVYIT